MKESMAKALIDASNVIGFDYDNDELSVTWEVAPGADCMLARRTEVYNNGDCGEMYYAVPYAITKLTDDIYENIVIDFVEFYYDDLRSNSSGDWNLFADIASPNDDGLLELLAFFARTYDDFLRDVFYWYGISVEAEFSAVKDEENEDEDEELCAGERLVRKVLSRVDNCELEIYNTRLEFGYSWVFVKANGEIWYSMADYSCGMLGHFVGKTTYGHTRLDDEVAMNAIRSIVSAELGKEGWEYHDHNNCLEMLGINRE